MTKLTVSLVVGVIAALLVLTSESFWIEALSLVGIGVVSRFGFRQ